MIKTFKRIMVRLIVTAFMLIIMLPSSLFVNAQDYREIQDLEKDTSLVASYFDVDSNGNVKYYRDKAINDGIDTELLDLADQVYAYGKTQYDNQEQSITIIGSSKSIKMANAKAVAFPAYGNWCGPGYGSGTPIDILDTGCKNHDNCYANVGYHKCSCDKTFLKYVQKNYSKMTGASQKAMAKVIETWLKIKSTHYSTNGGNFTCKK